MLEHLDTDTHYRNQFETASSSGLFSPETRERCKYGVLNVMKDHRGVMACEQYGDSYLVLKDVRLRCTFSPFDSANMKSNKLAVLDYYGHVLSDYSDAELHETIKVARSGDATILGNSEIVADMGYKEAQVHGPIAYKEHVERLVVAERHRGKLDESVLRSVCEKHGWAMSSMSK